MIINRSYLKIQDLIAFPYKILYYVYTDYEVITMAKQGMKRPGNIHDQNKNTISPVPEIQGKAKHGKIPVNPIIAGTSGVSQKVWHNKGYSEEKPISAAYKSIDNDLARDNLENDIPAADLQDI